MWYGPGWGPGYGWWIMPFFGIVFMVIMFYVISRFFCDRGSRGPFSCGREERSQERESIGELKEEIRELRAEIRALKEKQK